MATEEIIKAIFHPVEELYLQLQIYDKKRNDNSLDIDERMGANDIYNSIGIQLGYLQNTASSGAALVLCSLFEGMIRHEFENFKNKETYSPELAEKKFELTEDGILMPNPWVLKKENYQSFSEGLVAFLNRFSIIDFFQKDVFIYLDILYKYRNIAAHNGIEIPQKKINNFKNQIFTEGYESLFDLNDKDSLGSVSTNKRFFDLGFDVFRRMKNSFDEVNEKPYEFQEYC